MNHLCRGIALQTAHRAKKATGHTQAVREALAVGDPGKTRFLGPKSHVYVYVWSCSMLPEGTYESGSC